MRGRQLTVQIDEEILKGMEKIRDKTGLPISRQIDLRIKGYKIIKHNDHRELMEV